MILRAAVLAACALTAVQRIQASSPNCEHVFNLGDRLNFPPHWGFAPEHAQQFYEMTDIENRERLWISARLADFLDSAPDLLYEELSTVSSFELASQIRSHLAPEELQTVEEHYDLNRMGQFAYAHSITYSPELTHSLHTSDNAIVYWLFLHLLGGLKDPAPWGSHKITIVNQDQILRYLQAHKKERPSLGQVIQHSSCALWVIVDLIESSVSFAHTNEQVAELVDLWRRYLLDVSAEVPPHLAESFRRLKAMAYGEIVTSKAQLETLALTLTKLINGFLYAHQGELNDTLDLFQEWIQFLRGTVYIDSGIEPFLNALFVETAMNRPRISPHQLKTHLRNGLKSEIRTLRSEHKALIRSIEIKPLRPQPAPPAPKQPTKLTRQERMKTYLALKPGETAETQMKTLLMTQVIEEPEELEQSEPEQLLPASAEELMPTIYKVRLQRTGLIYRIQFSKDVIEQLARHVKTKVPDYKQWYEAITLGPAASVNETGWKKLTSPLYGIYSWEIKIAGSLWRLLGYRDGNKVWHFARFYSH